MAEHPIQRYSTTIEELTRARTKVQKMQQVIGEVHSALHRPYEFMVSNVSVGFPAEVAMVQGIPSLNANDWPNAQQIAEAIANLHQKYKQVNEAYRSLADEDKKIVNPPPAKK